MLIHSVNSDGLKRLLLLMEGSHWLNNSQSKDRDFSKQKNENEDNDAEVAKDIEGKGDIASNNTTDACLNLANEIDLASKLGGAVSSRHLYKYRCAQCSLAFKTTEKLANSIRVMEQLKRLSLSKPAASQTHKQYTAS